MKKCKSCGDSKFMKKLEYGIYHYAHSYCYKCQNEKHNKEYDENESQVDDVMGSIDELERVFD